VTWRLKKLHLVTCTITTFLLHCSPGILTDLLVGGLRYRHQSV